MTISEAFRQDAWTRQDPRRPNNYARRQALVEVDALAAKVPTSPWTNPKPSAASNSPLCANTRRRPTATSLGAAYGLRSKGRERRNEAAGPPRGCALTRVPANRPKHGAQATRNGVDTLGAPVS